ncbi:metal-dependent hydrolase [Halopenitus persicus]|uniref:metal-dependent hydrolase n=1 Tax=Halopenitus persicus TaxID=1048396 RepID=UPI000BBB49ED|nr:metal-dependent hydrolase [Halopenitus persicus]
MWPWEHAAVGYLAYSLALRALGKDPPSDVGTILLLFGTQLPDLVDKPLSWGLGVFPSGYALGHSVLVALPIGALVLAAGVCTARRRAAVAFVVGYWAHLIADVMNPLRYRARPAPERVLWPLVPGTPYDQDLGLGRGVAYLGDFLVTLQSMDPATLVVVYLLLPAGTALLWLHDGAPGVGVVVRILDPDRELRRDT